MVAKSIAQAMKKYPDLNGFLRLRKIYLREDVDIFFQVAVKHDSGRSDLAGIKVENVDQKSAIELATEMNNKLERVRGKKDTALQKTTRMFQLLPGFLVRFMLGLSSFISYFLNTRYIFSS